MSLRVGATVALILAALATATPAVAAPSLSIVGATSKPKEVALTKGVRGSLATGSLSIVVRNDSGQSGALIAEIARTTGNDRLQTNPATPTIASNSIAALTLKFSIPGAPPKLSGAVIIHLDGADNVKPAVLQVVGTQAQTATFEQKTSKFTVTRIFGPVPRLFGKTGLLNGKADVPMRNAGSLSTDPVTQTLIVASNGRTIRAVLHPPTRTPGRIWVGLLNATDVSRTGTYAGTLRLDPDDETSSSMDLAIGVQDLVIWPLFVIFLGAAAGGYGRRSYELWRQRKGLQTALQDAVSSYDAAYPTRSDDITQLNDRLGSPDSASDQAKRWDCNDKRLDVTKVFCQAGAADTVDKLAAAKTAVDALTADIQRWLALNSALKSLRKAKAGLPTIEQLKAGGDEYLVDEPDLVHRDTDELIGGPGDLEDADAVTNFTARAARQTAIAHAFTDAWEEFVKLNSRANEPGVGPLTFQVRTALRQNDPRRIYVEAQREYVRTKSQSSRLLERLAHSAEELAWYRRHPSTLRQPPAALDHRILERLEGLDQVLLADQLPASLLGRPVAPAGLGGLLLRLIGRGDHAPPHVPTAEETRSSVRFWDVWVFMFSSVVIAIVYLLPFYVDKAFGDWDDYLSAFVAGAAGTVLIPWELLPIFRTDKAQADKAQVAASG